MRRYKNFKIQSLGLPEQVDDKARVAFCLALIFCLIIAAHIISGDVGQAVFVGGMIGLAMHWIATWKCIMILPKWCYDRDIRPVIEHLGYRQTETNPSQFRVNLPRIFYFNHQDILLSISSGGTALVGPRYMLKIIRKRLPSEE